MQISKWIVSNVAVLILVLSFAATANEVIKPEPQAFEVVVVKPKQGVALEQFLQLDKVMEQQFVAKQPGFIKREVAVAKDGSVFVIVRWESLNKAEAAAQKFMADPTAKARNDAGEMTLYNHYILQ